MSVTGEAAEGHSHYMALSPGTIIPPQQSVLGGALFASLDGLLPHLGLQLPHEGCLPLLGLLGTLQLPPGGGLVLCHLLL